MKLATQAQIEAAAAAIANARAGRRGAPAITNVLEMLKRIANGKLYQEVMEDAKAALAAAMLQPPSSVTGPVTLSKPQRELCRFGGYEKDDLALARLIAAEVCESYGQDAPEELGRIRRGEIWNDHIAVQAALAAIRISNAL